MASPGQGTGGRSGSFHGYRARRAAARNGGGWPWRPARPRRLPPRGARSGSGVGPGTARGRRGEAGVLRRPPGLAPAGWAPPAAARSGQAWQGLPGPRTEPRQPRSLSSRGSAGDKVVTWVASPEETRVSPHTPRCVDPIRGLSLGTRAGLRSSPRQRARGPRGRRLPP